MSIQSIPPPLDKQLISPQGTTVTILKAQVQTDIQTSMGRVAKGITIECTADGASDIYSYIFSLDKEPVIGSAGRLAARTGAKKVDELPNLISKLKGVKVKVVNKNGKLYWY